jgi:catechol 2,3-dioxygenase-like lactoylglutathione lyase family enzyme
VLDGARIFHVNINCSRLARSRTFYVDGCGLTEGVRTAPELPQAGDAFGFDRAWWDALILVGANGFDGGAIDLLQWLEPEPTGAPPAELHEPGFQRIGIEVPDVDTAMASGAAHGGTGRGRNGLRDPDGTAVELIGGGPARLAFVAVRCRHLDASVDFYRVLGFREVVRLDGPDGDLEVVMDAPEPGEVQLRLVGSPAPATSSGDAADEGRARPANALGMWRVALLLPDLDGAVGRLAGAGIELLSDPQSMAMGPGLPELRFVCFRGPDREVVELIEAPDPG